MKMSAASSLTYNYDKDSFEEGTFEDISELSLEDVEEDESELDDNYSMELERGRIIMPKYSAKNKSLRTLMEEQKDEEELEESDVEQEMEKLEMDKNEIENINETSDEDDLGNSDTDYNEEDLKRANEHMNDSLDVDDVDNSDNEFLEENQKQTNEDNNENKNEINNKIDDTEEDNTDSDDMDIEMQTYNRLLESNKRNDMEFDAIEKSFDNTDTEGNSDSDKEDDEIINKTSNSVEKISNDYSNELLIEDEDKTTDYEEVITTETSVELAISSKRPSSFNSDEHAYHLDFIKKSQTSLKSNGQNKSKNVNRNLSFSNDRLRDIERQNKILLQRILTKKPTYENLTIKTSNKNLQAKRITSAAVNRKKQQHQIDLDNQILKRKLEAIALRRRATQ